jgi:hypothetical protein
VLSQIPKSELDQYLEEALLPRIRDFDILKGLFGKWRIEVDGRGLKGILGNFEL